MKTDQRGQAVKNLDDMALVERAEEVLRQFRFTTPRAVLRHRSEPEQTGGMLGEGDEGNPLSGAESPAPMTREEAIAVLREISERGSLPFTITNFAEHLLRDLQPRFEDTLEGRLLSEIEGWKQSMARQRASLDWVASGGIERVKKTGRLPAIRDGLFIEESQSG